MISRKVFGVFSMVVIVEHGASCLKILSKQGKAFMKFDNMYGFQSKYEQQFGMEYG